MGIAPEAGRRGGSVSLPFNECRWNRPVPRFGDARCVILNLYISQSPFPKLRHARSVPAPGGRLQDQFRGREIEIPTRGRLEGIPVFPSRKDSAMDAAA